RRRRQITRAPQSQLITAHRHQSGGRFRFRRSRKRKLQRAQRSTKVREGRRQLIRLGDGLLMPRELQYLTALAMYSWRAGKAGPHVANAHGLRLRDGVAA